MKCLYQVTKVGGQVYVCLSYWFCLFLWFWGLLRLTVFYINLGLLRLTVFYINLELLRLTVFYINLLLYFICHNYITVSALWNAGRLWLHVRSAGHWTKKLYEYFENYDPGVSEDDIEDMLVLDEIERRRRSTVQARRKSTIGM